MWPLRKKTKSVAKVTSTTREIGGVRVVKEDLVITHRPRLAADLAKLEILKALLDVIASEDLDSMFVSMLTDAQERGYNLRDEPQALLERLKRQYA